MIRYAADAEPLKAFSKKYDDPSNPQNGFYVIMTCSQADNAYPVVKGASSWVTVPDDDPKEFDGKHKKPLNTMKDAGKLQPKR